MADDEHKGKVYNPFGKISVGVQKFLDIQYILQSLADTVQTFDGSVELFKSMSDPQYDSSQVSDIVLLSLGKFLTETAQSSQHVSFAYGRGLSDSSQTNDTSLAYNMAMQLASGADAEDLVGVPDGITYQYAMTKADAASIGDVLARTVVYKRAPADSAQTSQTVVKTLGLGKAEAVDAASAPVWTMIKPLTETVNQADAPIMTTGLAKTDGASLNDVLAQVWSYNRSHADSAHSAESPVISFTKVLADTVTLVDSGGVVVGFQYDQPPTDSSQTSDISILAFGKVVAESIDAADAFARVVTYARAPAETVDAADALVQTIGMPKAEAVNTGDGFIIVQGKIFGDAADAAEASIRTINLVKSDAADAEDLVGVPDGITYQYAATKADAASASESLSRAWTALRSFGDTGDASDSPVVATAFNKPTVTDGSSASDSGQIFRLNYFDSDYVVASSTGPYNAFEIISFT